MDTLESIRTPEVTVDSVLIKTLLTDQYPDLATRQLGHRHDGSDHVTWRLGSDLAVRLPRHRHGAELLAMELNWLPQLSAQLPFATPVPKRIGAPSRHYPFWWAVVPWIDGFSAYRLPLNTRGATQLGAGLAALHQRAPDGAPQNPLTSASLVKRMDVAQRRVRLLERTGPSAGWHLNTALVRTTYVMGARQPRPRFTWTHPNLNGNNVLTANGELAGIVDWGSAGAGDPAADLGQAMILVGSDHWDTMLSAYGQVDLPLFTRALAEATDAALRLATIRVGLYARAGWRGLADLGLATGTTDHAPERSSDAPSP
jgi:aminoglycoside phosphotransferase (APT) family kinase protein